MGEVTHYDAAVKLCEAIERHRDVKYRRGEVIDDNDGRLYDAAIWFRSQQQEEEAAPPC